MQWPADHPALVDPALRPWADGVDEVRADLEFVRMLRHLPGRRVTSQVRSTTGDVVLKLFASPRARGNDRRLHRWKQSDVAPLVPAPLGADSTGHIGLVEFVPGTPLDRLDGADFVTALEQAGDALRRLHRSGVELDRSWTIDDELAQLERRVTERASTAVSALIAADPPDTTALVSAHRDCHTAQAVVHDGRLSWIDLDDAAMAPAGLDLGNLVAHLRRDGATGARPQPLVDAAIAALRSGYGEPPADTSQWEWLSLARLACLADARHGRADWAVALLDLLDTETDGLTRRATPRRVAPEAADGRPAVERVRAALDEFGLHADADPVPVGRHADRPVCRVDTNRGPVAVKLLSGDRDGSPARHLLALWDSPFGARRQPPGLAAPIGWSVASRALVTEWIDGAPLGAAGDGVDVATLDLVANLLADLHASGVRHRRVQDVEAIMRSTRRKAADLADQDVGRAAGRLADLLSRTLPDDGAFVPTHGDFAPPNLLRTPLGLRLIDLDRLQLADPARDLSYFGAWCWATRILRDAPSHWDEGDELLERYAVRRGVAVPAGQLRFHRATALLRIAHGWSAFRAAPTRSLAVLDEAQRIAAT